MAILQLAIWRSSAILNFWNLVIMSRDLYGHAIFFFPVQNFNEIGQSAAELWPIYDF